MQATKHVMGAMSSNDVVTKGRVLGARGRGLGKPCEADMLSSGELKPSKRLAGIGADRPTESLQPRPAYLTRTAPKRTRAKLQS